MKLRQEDFKNRSKYDIVTGCEQGDSAWIDSFGKQAQDAGLKTQKTKSYNENAMKDHWQKTLSMTNGQRTSPIF